MRVFKGDKNKYNYIMTDGVSIFHEVDQLESGQVATGQLYVIRDKDKDKLMSDVFDKPKKEDQEYTIDKLTPLSKDLIIQKEAFMGTTRQFNRKLQQGTAKSIKQQSKLDKVKTARYMEENIEDSIYEMLKGPSKFQRLGTVIKSKTIKVKDKISNIKLTHKLVIRLERVADSLEKAEQKN